jgi:hypothetical protein
MDTQHNTAQPMHGLLFSAKHNLGKASRICTRRMAGLGASFTASPLACSRQQNQFSIFVRVHVAVQQSTAGP